MLDAATIMQRISPEPLRLAVVSGPPVEPIALQSSEAALIGKEAPARIRLQHAAVSRRHALLEPRAGDWFITDLGSRNGTFVNGRKLDTGSGVPLAHGDHIRISPWVFRCILGRTLADTQTTEDQRFAAERVEPLSQGTALGQVHLTSVMKASAAIYSAGDEPSLWDTLLDWALALTGFQRGAIVREGRDLSSVEIRARRTRDGAAAPHFEFSRTLLSAASQGRPVHLRGDQATPGSNSLMSMEISEAACIPLALDGAVWGCMYLDSGGGGRPIAPESAQVCSMLGDIGSLALANLLRRDVESRFATMRKEAEFAAEAQRLLLPPDHGRIDGVEYAVRFRPGRLVSGDLVGIVPLSTGRIAVFIGDVTGKGFGAGLVMTVIQSYLSGSLACHDDAAAAVMDLNRHISHRLPPGCFASLWLGIVDTRRCTLSYVDAGHGFSFMIRDGIAGRLHSGSTVNRQDLTRDTDRGGVWLGVDAQTRYHATTMDIQLTGRPDRFILCSDGVAEQNGPEGEQFGLARVLSTLDSTRSVREAADALLAAVTTFARTDTYRDDLTIISFALASDQEPA